MTTVKERVDKFKKLLQEANPQAKQPIDEAPKQKPTKYTKLQNKTAQRAHSDNDRTTKSTVVKKQAPTPPPKPAGLWKEMTVQEHPARQSSVEQKFSAPPKVKAGGTDFRAKLEGLIGNGPTQHTPKLNKPNAEVMRDHAAPAPILHNGLLAQNPGANPPPMPGGGVLPVFKQSSSIAETKINTNNAPKKFTPTQKGGVADLATEAAAARRVLKQVTQSQAPQQNNNQSKLAPWQIELTKKRDKGRSPGAR
jgi:hypothetical protein